jgi:hypothetical protein
MGMCPARLMHCAALIDGPTFCSLSFCSYNMGIKILLVLQLFRRHILPGDVQSLPIRKTKHMLHATESIAIK